MKKIYLMLAMLFAGTFAMAQFNIDAGATTYTQDFNTLASTGTPAWTNNTTLTGWYAKNTPGPTVYVAGTGSSNAGAIYSFGAASNAERALGSVASGTTGTNYYGWRLKNNTGSTITSITVTWDGEQWRKENNASLNLLTLSYQTGVTVTDLTAGTWTASGSTFTSPIAAATTATALDGNAPANRVDDIVTVITVNIPAGQEIMLRWEDLNDAGSDHGLAIDDVRINATLLVAATPDIALSSATPAVPAGNMAQGSDNNLIYDFDLAVTTGDATFNGLTITTAGTYAASDIENLKVYYSSDNTFSPGTDVLLATKTTGLGAGTQAFPAFTQVINQNTTGYIFVTADAACGATLGNTISVDAITTSDISFASGNKTGTASAGDAQTIVAGTPVDVTGASALQGNTTSTISWTPAGCYDEVLIVASDGAANSGTPSGDGTAYTGNLAFGSGSALGNGFVVYKGTTSPQTVTNLTNGNTYYFKIFTRLGTTWSSGVEVSATPAVVTVATDYFRSVTDGLWTASSTWESSADSITWIPASLTPTVNANSVTIRFGDTVNIAASVTVDQVYIKTGGFLNNSAGFITVNDNAGTPDDLTIEYGGVLSVVNVPLGTGVVRMQTGGVLRVAGTGILDDFGPTRFVFENNSVLQYALPTAPPTSGVTFFPNVDANTVPILHFMQTIGTAVGGGSATVINGGFLASGAVTFTGTGTKTFRNGIITNGPGSVTQGTSGQFIINGTQAALGGTINIGAAGMVINSGTNAALASNLVLNGGTLTINGILDAGLFEITGTGSIILNGTLITANVDGISSVGTLGNTGTNTMGVTSTVVYNGTGVQQFTSGTYANVGILGGGTKVLNGPVTVNGILALTDGVVVSTTPNLLTLGTTAMFTGGSDLSYVDGPMARMTNAAATYTFPVGEDGDYRPFDLITATADPATFTGDYNTPNVNTTAPTCTPARLEAYTSNEFWLVDRTAGITEAAIRLNYEQAMSTGTWTNGSTAMADPDNTKAITVAVYLPATSCWEVYPDVSTLLLGDALSGQTATHAINAFGAFTFGYGPLAALPVKINYIRGANQNDRNNLTWSVTCLSSPTINMVLERSADSRNYTGIHAITATDTRCLEAFFYTDNAPLAGNNFYRLKITDIDGKISYSQTIALTGKQNSFELVSLSPNPVHSKTVLSVSSAVEGVMSVRIINMSGKVVAVQSFQVVKGSNLLTLDLSRFAAGTYQLTAVLPGMSAQTIRLIKQ